MAKLIRFGNQFEMSKMAKQGDKLKTMFFSLNRKTIAELFKLFLGKNLKPFDGVNISQEVEDNMDKSFEPHYNEHVFPLVKEFEKKRIEILKKTSNRMTITVVTAIALAVVFVISGFFTDFGDGIAAFLFLMSFVVLWASTPVFKYKSSIKEKVFKNIFNFFGDDFTYSEEGQFTIESLKTSDIIPSYQTEYTEDYIKGKYKDVDIELTEGNLFVTGNDSSNKVYGGLFILLSMNKNFSGKTIIKKDAGKVGNWFNKAGKLENVKLEDPIFEKKFEVSSSDQIEARYLLTTSFMERLLKLSELFGDVRNRISITKNSIQCSFYDDKL